MKKRILASLLSLCLLVGLLPTAAMAVDETSDNGEPVVCTCEALCTEEAVDENCPVCAEDFALCAYQETPADGDENTYYETDDVTDPAAEQLVAMIAALPAPEEIEPLDEKQVEEVYNQIAEIYAFAEANGLDVEDNETVNAVIAALCPAEPLETPTTESDMAGNCGADDSTTLTWKLEENSDALYRTEDEDGTITFSSTGNDSNKVAAYTLTISGSGKMGDYTNVTTPWGVKLAEKLGEDGTPVDVMNDADPRITQINIEEGITYIGSHAFRSTGISTITIPASVTEIGNYALIRCKNLTEIELAGTNNQRPFYVQDGVLYETYNEDGRSGVELRFYPASKTTGTFTIPDGVTALGPNSMQDAQFSSVTIPASVRSINSYALCAAENLTSVTLPENVAFGVEREVNADPGAGVFASSTKLSTIENFPQITEIPTNMFSSTALASFKIPETVQKIALGAFRGTQITEFTIPANVEEIGGTVFAAAVGEEGEAVKLTFSPGSKLTSIGSSCFLGRDYSVAFAPDDMNAYLVFTKAGYKAEIEGQPIPTDETFVYAWAGKDELRIVGLTESGEAKAEIEIPDTVSVSEDSSKTYKIVEIAAGAFAGASSSTGANTTLTKVTIGENAKIIGDRAFKYCQGIKELDFSKATALESIGAEAFYNLVALNNKEIDLSACTALTSIGNSAFQYTVPKLLKLPDNITTWGKNVVAYTNTTLSVSESTTLATVTAVLESASDNFGISGVYKNLAYTVVRQDSALTVSITGFADGGSEDKGKVEIPDEIGGIPVTEVKANAFNGSETLTTVTIGANVSKIGEFAFSGPASSGKGTLATVTFKSGVPVEIGKRAFQKHGSASNGTFDAGDRELTLGDNVFLGSEFVTINMPNVQKMGKGVFYSNTKKTLKTLVINGAATCDEYTFCNSTGSENTTNSVTVAKIYVVNAATDAVSTQIKALGNVSSNVLCIADGGTVDVTGAADETTGLYVPVKKGTGMVFDGWYDSSNQKLEATASTGTYTVKWRSSSYTVSSNNITFGSKTYGEISGSETVTVTGSGGTGSVSASSSNDEVFTVFAENSQVTVTPVATLSAGDYSETITITAPDGATFSIPVTLSVTKAGSTVTPGENSAAITATYGDTITLTAKTQRAETGIALMAALDEVEFICGQTSLGTAEVTYDANSVGTATLTYDTSRGGIPVGGTAYITAQYGGSVNLNGSSNNIISVTLSPKALTVTGLTATDRTYDGTVNVALTGGTLSGVLSSDTVTADMPTTGTMADANAGDNKPVTVPTITLTGQDASKYTLTQPDAVTVNISKATYDMSGVTFENVSYPYDGNEHELTISGTLPTGVNVSYSNNKMTDVGSTTATASFTGDSTNYEAIASMTATLMITAAASSVTITPSATALTGGGTVKLTVSGVPADGTVIVTQTDDQGSAAKTLDLTSNGEISVSLSNTTATYTFTVSYAGNSNHAAASDTCTVTVTRKSTGGGSGGSSSYTVSVDSTRNGDVTVSPKNASKGSKVTITVKPNSGYELDELTVTDKNGDTVKLTRKSGTQYTFTMPASKVTVEASFVAIEAEPDEGLPFVDVAESAYYYDAVAWAVENDITGGTSATTFSPNQTCTRAQAVTFLWRSAGSPAPKTTSNPFTDVSTSAYYYDAVLWAVEKGITAGTSATTFGPNNTCTRGQIVTFMYRADGSPVSSGSSFADVSADAYYAGAVAWAVTEGITSGTSATTFGPGQSCTRAQIVTFLYRANA